MNRAKIRSVAIYCTLAAIMTNTIIPPQVFAGGWSFYKVSKPTTVEKLAKKIDHVQHRLDKFGTIVAKTPDVWGESRLLQHRDEFEKELTKDLKMFRETLQGAQSTRDSAFLASALSLSNVLGTPVATSSTSEKAESNTQIFVATPDQLVPDNEALNAKDSRLVPRSEGFGPRFVNKFTSGVSTEKGEPLEISLEPTVYLDQKKRYLDHLHALRRLNEGDDIADSPGYALNLVRIPVSVLPGRETRKGYGAQVSITVDPYASEELLPESFRNFVVNGVIDSITPSVTKLINDDKSISEFEKNWDKYIETKQSVETDSTYQKMSLKDKQNFREDATKPSRKPVLEFLDKGRGGRSGVIEQLGSAPFVNSKRAYPPSLSRILSGTSLAPVIISAYKHLQMNGDAIHLEDVRRYLNIEIQAAYDLLSQDKSLEIWHDQNLLDNLKNAIIELRTAPSGKTLPDNQLKFSQLRAIYHKKMKSAFPGADYSTTVNLGWHILVESVMLNERLIEDMKSVSANKNCCQMPPDGLQFYGPNPSIEARVAFQDYIRCRWPIQVFSLDPVTDDQNISDAFSQRRELQLALAIAASKGMFGMQNLTRFVRRMEYDLETIQLNRTAVGFSHGNDTFGWRFYPRVQTSPAPGSIKAFGQTLIGGQSREKRLKHQMLEPAMRECSALIVMPSFIPYITVDVQTNWFKLSTSFVGKAFKRHLDLSDAVELSKDVTTLRELASACKKDAHLYRDGETHRLLRAVDQIERQLPLQTAYVQIPYENNLSGFEIFNNGVTDLGPELIDWYGGPGISVGGPGYSTVQDIHESISNSTKTSTTTTLEKRTQLTPDLKATTLFLIGKNFTSLGEKTRIIAGGLDVSDSRRLISRNVIQVTIPAHALVESTKIDGKDHLFVDIHLATPHGVTSHLEIPAIMKAASAAQVSINSRLKTLENEIKSVKKNPPLQFEWLKPEMAGCLDLLNSPRSVNLKIRDAVRIKINSDILPNEVNKIRLIANVQVSTDGKKFGSLVDEASQFPKPIVIDANILRWTDNLNKKFIAGCEISSDDLSLVLTHAIFASTRVNNDIKAIKLSGNIQIFLDNNLDPLPLYSVNNSLTIKLARCKECKNCNDASPSPAPTTAPVPSESSKAAPARPAPPAVQSKPKAPVLKPFSSSIQGPPVSRPLGWVKHESEPKTTSNSGFTVSISP